MTKFTNFKISFFILFIMYLSVFYYFLVREQQYCEKFIPDMSISEIRIDSQLATRFEKLVKTSVYDDLDKAQNEAKEILAIEYGQGRKRKIKTVKEARFKMISREHGMCWKGIDNYISTRDKLNNEFYELENECIQANRSFNPSSVDIKLECERKTEFKLGRSLIPT